MLYKCAYCLHDASIMIMSGNYPQFNTLGLSSMNQVCAARLLGASIWHTHFFTIKLWTCWLMLQVLHKHPHASPWQPKCQYFLCREPSEREVFAFSNRGRLLSEEECKHNPTDHFKTVKHDTGLPLNGEYSDGEFYSPEAGFFPPIKGKFCSSLCPPLMSK